MIKHWIILILKGKTLMIKISLCMIVKNEAAILSRCLDSVCDLMDEIIIVDTGSTDDTKAVAAKPDLRFRMEQ